MGSWLSEREQRLVAGAETASAATPIPTQIVSNGEYLPPPQSETQKRLERRILELADTNAKRLGLSRRQFMQTSCGMAAAFVLNQSRGMQRKQCVTALRFRKGETVRVLLDVHTELARQIPAEVAEPVPCIGEEAEDDGDEHRAHQQNPAPQPFDGHPHTPRDYLPAGARPHPPLFQDYN